VDKLPTLASELVGLKVDVILTTGTPATRTAKEATKTIPIVFIVAVDPVETGLVASFARPDGNILVTYGGKLLEVLKEAVPEPEPLELPIDLRVRYHQNTLPEAPYFQKHHIFRRME
jgi:ABC transporter substrate binding protein